MLNDRYWDMCVAIVTCRGETFCGPKQSWSAYENIVRLTVIWLNYENKLGSKTYLINRYRRKSRFSPILQTLTSFGDLYLYIT